MATPFRDLSHMLEFSLAGGRLGGQADASREVNGMARWSQESRKHFRTATWAPQHSTPDGGAADAEKPELAAIRPSRVAAQRSNFPFDRISTERRQI